MSWLLPSLFLVLLIFQEPLCTCSSISDLFETWCQQHGKKYSSEQERVYRFKVFEENYAYITEHNSKGNSSYTLGLNAYSDLTHHEFRNSFLGLSSSANDFIRFKRGGSGSSATGVLSDVDIPSSLDWREKGAVTNVKDQGSCGACWSFSATGAMEGINKISTGSLISLSEQELIDCDRSYNQGCEGGLMDYAFKFVIKNGGIDTEQDYPFRERDGTCNKNKLQRRVVTIDGYTDIPQNDEDKLLKAVATQPVSVGICGSARAFQSYSKGIFTGPCSTELDHAVLIVGYGSENGLDYWIIKNSWGTSWGINGYMHMQRNSGDQEGICGINKLASYPTKTGPNPPTPPAPGPTRCSTFTSCGQGETCCCGLKLLGICLSWKCCEPIRNMSSSELIVDQLVPTRGKRPFASEAMPANLNYKILYTDSVKKIEALTEENYRQAQKLFYMLGKVKIYENVIAKDMVDFSNLWRPTGAATNLSDGTALNSAGSPKPTPVKRKYSLKRMKKNL